MVDKTTIALGVEIDGVEMSIKSVKDLKNNIKQLQDEVENADIGSEQYKNAVEQLDLLNEKLKEVTRTEKQNADATEAMAKAEKEATKETQDLRKQFEVLEDELFLLAGQGKQNTKQFKDLTVQAAALNKKIDEVNQSLGGNETERAAMGMAKLNEGFRNLDFKSVKEGFSAMKTAVAAVGIGLFVQLVTYLYENFDKLSKGSGALAKSLRFVGDTIKVILQVGEQMLNFVTDIIGLTSEAQRTAEGAAQASAKATEAAIKKTTDALNNQTKSYDQQIAVLQAAGKDTIKLEKEKLDNIFATNYALVEQLSRKQKLSDEEKKMLDAALEAVKNSANQSEVLEAKILKSKEDKQKVFTDKQKEKNKKDNDDYLKEVERRWQEELALQRGYQAEADAEQMALETRQEQQDAAMIAGTAARNEAARLAKEQKDKEQRDKEKLGHETLEKEKLNITKQGLEAVQALTEVYFLFKSQRAAKGSKEEEEIAKKAFQVNKALQLSTATINGIQSVQGAFATATASPITTVFPAYPFVQAGLAGVFAAANIAKIAASKFSGSGGGSVSSPSAPNVSIPSAPTINTTENKPQQASTTFDEQGKTMNTINVVATVGVDEITKKTKRVQVLENQSTF